MSIYSDSKSKPIKIITKVSLTSNTPEFTQESPGSTWNSYRSPLLPPTPDSPLPTSFYNPFFPSPTYPASGLTSNFPDDLPFGVIHGPDNVTTFGILEHEQFPDFLTSGFICDSLSQDTPQYIFDGLELSPFDFSYDSSNTSPLSSVSSSDSSTSGSAVIGDDDRGRMPGGFYFPRTMDTRNRTSRSISPSPSNAAINDDSSGLRVGSRSRADSSPSIGNVSNMAHFGGQERGVESSLYPNLFPPTITGLDSVLPAQDIVSSNSGRIKHSEYDPGPTIPISVSTRRPSIPSVVTIPVRQTHAITYRTDTRNTNIHELRREDYTATSYVPVRSKVAADAVSQAMIKRRRKAALFKCCKCGADFTTKQNLNHHMNSHYNIKDHKCECGRGFGTRHVMRRHRNSCSIAKGNSPSGN